MEEIQKSYTIVKVLNNSSVLVKCSDGECIFLSNGLGFGKKPGEEIIKGTQIEKKFNLHEVSAQFEDIINGYSPNIVKWVAEAITLLHENIDDKIRSEAIVAFSDHIAAMLVRIQTNEPIANFFLYETKALYPDSFARSQRICDGLGERSGIMIPESEVAFVAMHIHNIVSKNPRLKAEKLNTIIYLVDEILTEDGHFNGDKSSLDYTRFLTHLRFVVERVLGSQDLKGNELEPMIRLQYPRQIAISEKIITVIQDELKKNVSQSEVVYLTVHLIKII